MRCDRYRGRVRALARGESDGGRRVRRHVASCLRCQAEIARERRLQRQLKSLRQEQRTPRGLLERILATIEDAAPPQTPRSAPARTAGVVAGAGALAGVIVVGLGTRAGRRALGLAS